MHFEKIHNKGQARLFQSQYLEILTKTHPLVIWGIYMPVMFVCCITAVTHWHLMQRVLWSLFIGGMVFWTLFEYIMHRFVFHFVAENPGARKFIYVLHGNHHDYPRDKKDYSCHRCRVSFLLLRFFPLCICSWVGMLRPFSRLCVWLSHVWHYALCYSCMESSL